MALLYATDAGAAAWQRMARDGVVVALSAGVGHSPTTERTAALRAASLADAVPRKATLAGAAALWVHGWRADVVAPSRIEIAVPRGCHPDPPPGFSSPWWQFVTDGPACASARVIGGVSVADAPSALTSILSRGDLGEAIDAAWWALTEGGLDARACTASLASHARGQAGQRALAAWKAVCEAAGGP